MSLDDSRDRDQAETREIVVAGKKMSLEKARSSVHSSANWFWWVAGLSVANSVAILAELNYGMILGLGVTQIVDGIAVALLKEASGTAATVIKFLHLVVVGAAAGFFYLIGVKARQLRLWAYRVGLAAYALDALIFVIFKDWVAVGFHVFVLFMLWGGYGIAKVLVAEESTSSGRFAV